MKTIRLATVFSGIGSIEFALKRMNIPHVCVFACDNGERDIDYDFEKEYVEVDIDLLTNIINSKKEQYCDNDIVKSCLDEILKLVKNN